MKVVQIAVSEIVESPTNPRKTFTKEAIAELAADIGQHGVLQPVCVREREQGYELVFGHRRLRAAKLAGLEAVPAVVEQLTDQQVLERQLAENLKRDDLHPLELAAGYHELHTRFGVQVDDIATRIGKSRGHVYAKLKLLELGDKGRAAYRDGQLSESIALLVARVPSSLQPRAVETFTELNFRKEPMTYREATAWVQRELMLDLRKAPFKTNDVDLVPSAGACDACPKRTGANRDLYGDVASADVCTDPICHRSKLEAHVARQAEQKGVRVLTEKQSKKIFDQWGHVLREAHGSYVAADTTCYDDAKLRAYGSLLKPAEKAKLTTLAINPRGELVELLDVDGLKPALKASGKLRSREVMKRAPAAKASPKEKQLAATRSLREKVVPLAVPLLVTAVEKRGLDKALLQVLAGELMHNEEGVSKRRWQGAAAKGRVEKLSAEQLAGLVFELVLEQAFIHTYAGYSAELQAVSKLLGVDLKKLEAQVTPEQAPAPKKAGKRAAA